MAILSEQVSLLLPECSSAPSHLESVVNSFSSFYLIRNLPIYELLDKHFLEMAVYHGNTRLYLYHQRDSPVHTCISLTCTWTAAVFQEVCTVCRTEPG